jgi:hypothetical protein
MFAVLATGLLAIGGSTSAGPAETQGRTALGLPADCRLGEECFVQQMPDIDPHGGILDPLCGNAATGGTRACVYDLRVELLAGNRKVQSTTRSFEL